MNIKQLTELDEKELEKKLKEFRIELIKLNGQVSTGTPPKSPARLSLLKKSIARIKSIAQKRGVQING